MVESLTTWRKNAIINIPTAETQRNKPNKIQENEASKPVAINKTLSAIAENLFSTIKNWKDNLPLLIENIHKPMICLKMHFVTSIIYIKFNSNTLFLDLEYQ